MTSTNLCRWDSCFIRFLDGMLQTSALGSTDYQLRIPVKLRHVAVADASPNILNEASGPSPPPLLKCILIYTVRP